MKNQLFEKTDIEQEYEMLEKKNNDIFKNNKKKSLKELESEYRAMLINDQNIKAVTVCFSDIEGRFHMLDYDKSFFLSSDGYKHIDGRNIRGFGDSDDAVLLMKPDWKSMRFVPRDIFGDGKVIIFADMYHTDESPCEVDARLRLAMYVAELKKTKNIQPFLGVEIEGLLVAGTDAEQEYEGKKGFELIAQGGYYHSLPLDTLKIFIDKTAAVQRAVGFQNEKDHPEIAPSQFELAFSSSTVRRACDNAQLYKVICRQVATNMGMTATFLPKPVSEINDNGMHLNISFKKNGKNIIYDEGNKDNFSKFGQTFVSRLLNHAAESCLIFNSSVNAYRRLDEPNAQNQIKAEVNDSSSMILIHSLAKESARIEMRSVAPDANIYLATLTMLKIGFDGHALKKDASKRDRVRFLPSNIKDAIKQFKSSDIVSSMIGPEMRDIFATHKQVVSDRSPKELGTRVKKSEVIYHHEVTNQVLWNEF